MIDHGTLKIGFIGGGNMAQAIIHGLLQAGHQPDRISCADPSADQRAAVGAINNKIKLTDDNGALAAGCDVLVLAVKPQIMAGVAEKLADSQRAGDQLIVSIAAGITLQSLIGWFGPAASIVRVMPNQPSLISAGMSGLCATDNVDTNSQKAATYLLTAIGEAAWFDDEQLIDAVTAVSGSGPAYFYLIMEVMQEIAGELGLDKETARLLCTQTALGAARVAVHDDEDLATLRAQVTSPGGTTAAALDVLENAGIRDIFRRALVAARDRSVELGQVDD
jgi:pyrroline-5-carboxylate reductase